MKYFKFLLFLGLMSGLSAFGQQANTLYNIVNVSDSQLLSVTNSSTTAGATVDQYTNVGASSQNWQFIPVGNGNYYIKNANSGLYLSVQGASIASGATIIQDTPNSSVAEQWTLSSNSGKYTITNVGSTYVLEDPGFSTTAGAVMDQYPSNGGTNQQWTLTSVGPAQATISQWNYSRPLTIDHTQVGSGTNDESAFPVIFNLSDPTLKTTGNGGHIQSQTGADIALYSDSGLTQLLPFELISYDGTHGTVQMAVQLNLSHTADTVFYVAYGSGTVVSSLQQPTKVWSSYYGVYHLDDNATSTGLLNSVNGDNSTANSTVPTNTLATSGKLGNGLTFSATQSADLGAYSVINAPSALTISGWVKFNALSDFANVVGDVTSTSGGGSAIGLSSSTLSSSTSNSDWAYRFTWQNSNYHWTNGFGITPGTWYQFAIVYFHDPNGDSALYINGVKVGTSNNNYDASSFHSTADMILAGGVSEEVDEVHISPNQRTADWINTEYKMASSATFTTMGTESSLNGTIPSTLTSFPVTVDGVTATQAILSYSAPDNNACSVAVKDDPKSNNVIHDVDSQLFAGSNLDTRTGNIVNGQLRKIIVGKGGTQNAADGRIYSRALQAQTRHYYTISCDNGYQATGTFTTANIPVGDTAPVQIPFNSSGFGNYGWPTINFNDKSVKYIDPVTGTAIYRATDHWDDGPDSQSTYNYGVVQNGSAQQAVYDYSGGKWANLGNFDASGGDGKVATYNGNGGPQDSIFVYGNNTQWRYGYIYFDFSSTDDALVHIKGYGDSVSVCPSADFGQTCLSNPLIYNLSAGTTPVDNTGPNGNSFPSFGWGTWGPNKVAMDQLVDQYGGTLDTSQSSGSTIVWQGGSSTADAIWFPSTLLKPGMKVFVANSAPSCTNNMCTLSSAQQTAYHLTINETLPSGWAASNTFTLSTAINYGDNTHTIVLSGTPSNNIMSPLGFVGVRIETEDILCFGISGNSLTSCYDQSSNSDNSRILTHAAGVTVNVAGWEVPAFGFKIWKNPGGTGTVSIDDVQVTMASANGFGVGVEGNGNFCSSTFPVSWDKSGNPLSTPLQGELCTIPDNWNNKFWYTFIPSTGELRRMGPAKNGLGGQMPYDSITYDRSSGFFQQCAYDPTQPATNGGHFVDWSGKNNNGNNPAIVCNYLQTQYTMMQEVHMAHPELNLSAPYSNFTSSPFDIGYGGYTASDGTWHPVVIFSASPAQDARDSVVAIDLSNAPGASQVIGVFDTWSNYPQTWSGAHGSLGFSPYNGYIQSTQENLSAELWHLKINKVYNNGTNDAALPANFSDPSGCSGLGLTDTYWLSFGTNCVKMNIDPAIYKTSVDTTDKGCDTLSGHCLHQGELTPFESTEIPGGVAGRVGPWPHNATSCGGDGSTSNCYGWLRNAKQGDWFVDPNYGISSSEHLILAKYLSTLSDGSQDWVVIRAPEHTVGDPSGNPCYGSQQSHTNGWVGQMVISMDCSANPFFWPIGQQPNQNNIIIENHDPYSSHGDGWIKPDGREVFVSSQAWATGAFPHKWGGWGQYGAYDSSPATYYADYGPEFPVNSNYPFDDNDEEVTINDIQTHPGGDTWAAPAKESIWAVDGRPYGQAHGGNNPSAWSQTYTLVTGQAHTYQISDPTDADWPSDGSYSKASVHDVKRRRMVAFAGYNLLQDISGPNSVINDSTPWSYCIVVNAGECVSGSTAGQMYVSIPNATVANGACSLQMQLLTPCLTVGGPAEGGYTQFAIDKEDALGSRYRLLTYGFNGPARSSNFMSMHGFGPDGLWTVFQGQWLDGKRAEDMILKLPTWPNEDSVLRDYFVKTPVTVSGQAGTSVRIRFGYNPNLYCVSRQDQCTTAPANSDPFAFASEPQSWTSTTDPTKTYTINIPAFANRILYYQIDRKDANGNVVSSPIKLMAIN